MVSEADIVRAVQAARAGQGRVRAWGARGSKNESHGTTGVALHLERYRRLLSVEDNLVTVQGGMTCGDLNAALERHGFALPTMGEWKRASVAGALLTGTHGGSSRHGIMPTSMRRVRLVAGDGRFRAYPEHSSAYSSVVCSDCQATFLGFPSQ